MREFKESDVGIALFALGRFIDYRLEEGMNRADLEPWMQAYLNLEATLEGREPHALHALQAQTVAASPAERVGMNQWGPSWLPDCEKLRLHRKSLETCRYSGDPDRQG